MEVFGKVPAQHFPSPLLTVFLYSTRQSLLFPHELTDQREKKCVTVLDQWAKISKRGTEEMTGVQLELERYAGLFSEKGQGPLWSGDLRHLADPEQSGNISTVFLQPHQGQPYPQSPEENPPCDHFPKTGSWNQVRPAGLAAPASLFRPQRSAFLQHHALCLQVPQTCCSTRGGPHKLLLLLINKET